MTLEERQEQLIAQINTIGDCFDQYSYLIVRSHDLPPYPEKYRIEEYLVKGCQSKVWIHTAFPGGVLHLDCDSDALILKGVLAILRELAEGTSARELAALEWSFLDRTELGATFTSARSAGMQRVLQTLHQDAQDALSAIGHTQENQIYSAARRNSLQKKNNQVP